MNINGPSLEEKKIQDKYRGNKPLIYIGKSAESQVIRGYAKYIYTYIIFIILITN